MISKYYKYEIYTEVTVKVTHKNYLPAITFCDNNLMLKSYFAYCGVGQGDTHRNISQPCDNHEVNYTHVSTHKNISQPCNNHELNYTHVSFIIVVWRRVTLTGTYRNLVTTMKSTTHM